MGDTRIRVTRREALIAGAGLVGATVALTGAPVPTLADRRQASPNNSGSLPVEQIEDIMEVNGTVTNGVLALELDRDDLKVMGPGGVPFKPSFEENHTFDFQPISGGRAFLNAEMSLLPQELNLVIDKIFEGGLFFMSEHQHFFDETPQTFHIHYKGIGDPIQLAKAAIATVKVTGTPLPQQQPANPPTPLPVNLLAKIIGGTATVGKAGVVTISVPRAETIYINGIPILPQTGISVDTLFEPLNSSGTLAACAPDYGLIASEINPALSLSRLQGFVVHCLYNQETAEQPQLYFSHNLATGDPIDLAHKVSRVLDTMNVKRM